MPVTKSVDLFIERSAKLLEARPDTTHVSITYGKNKTSKDTESEKETRKTKNFVNFKTYDPVSGVCIKTKTYKMKELSRLLNFLGPRGVQVTKHKKVSKTEGEEKDVKVELQSEIVYQRGLSSFMSNTEFENLESTEKESTPVPAVVEANTAETADSASKAGKKNKKKNKKR